MLLGKALIWMARVLNSLKQHLEERKGGELRSVCARARCQEINVLTMAYRMKDCGECNVLNHTLGGATARKLVRDHRSPGDAP